MLVRLRAEYAWTSRSLSGLAFHYTSGHLSAWSEWAGGKRPVVRGKLVHFEESHAADDSRENFCGYLETLFRYTTVYSLLEDTRRNEDGTIAGGDIFVTTSPPKARSAGANRPGHAVMVLDVAMNEKGHLRILLGQGGNPAVSFHVPRSDEGSPWFAVSRSSGITLQGRTWFRLTDLRHWK